MTDSEVWTEEVAGELYAGLLQPVTLAGVANSVFRLPNNIQKEDSPEIH